jgi:hypothetical protein
MSDVLAAAIASLDELIVARRAELQVIEDARAKLAPAVQAVANQKRLPAPARRGRSPKPRPKPALEAKDGDGVWIFDGKSVPVNERQEAVLDILAAAPEGDYVPFAQLLPIYDNKLSSLYQDISALRGKLERLASCTLRSQRGKGYLLDRLA